eukprot:6377983-Amphidinium_carterae.2
MPPSKRPDHTPMESQVVGRGGNLSRQMAMMRMVGLKGSESAKWAQGSKACSKTRWEVSTDSAATPAATDATEGESQTHGAASSISAAPNKKPKYLKGPIASWLPDVVGCKVQPVPDKRHFTALYPREHPPRTHTVA